MWKKLTVTAAMFSLAMLVAMVLALPLAADPPPGKGGGKKEPVPGGPGLIAFNDYGDFGASGTIALMNPDGSGYTPVAEASSGRQEPAWSPMFSDGTVKLAYPGYDSVTESYLLMVVDVFPNVGEPVHVLTETSGGLFQPDWSPAVPLDDDTDSVKVCFTTYKTIEGEYREVIEIVDLIYDPGTGAFSPTSPDPLVLDAGLGSNYHQARFSPDGQWLALGRGDREDGDYHKSIWLASADGTVQEPLIDEPGVYNWYPAWSPDSSQLAFISNRDFQGFRKAIYVASLSFDGNGGVYIEDIQLCETKGEKTVDWPTWSPDGLQIAYYQRGTNPKIGKVLLATGEQFKLAGGAYPDWSPMDLPPLP